MRKIEPKTDEMGPMVETSGKMKKHEPIKTYPNLRLEHDFFPEAKKWEVLKEYTVTLKLKMTGLSISKFQNNSEFDIIGFGTGSEKDEYKEEEKE